MDLRPVSLILTYYFLQATYARGSDENFGIVGGHDVHIEDAPYIAAIIQDGVFACVGSIVHKSFILTSASCSAELTTDQKQKVLIGTDKIKQGGKLHEIEETFCHHHYDPKTVVNDICLLKLSKKIEFGKSIKRVRLPDPNEDIAAGTLFNVTGWGSLDSEGKTFPKILQQASVSVISNEVCNEIYHNIRDTMVCTFTQGHDACLGDIGAPLTIGNVQYALFSTTNTRGCSVAPSVYTRVTKFVDWIHFIVTTYDD